MQDRVPLYPGRVTLTPVSGQANTFDLVRADQPTQEGTPLNKASLLKDATAALFGLGTDAVPDDVLSQIFAFENNLGNMWVWRKAEPDFLGPGSSIDYGAEWKSICTVTNTSLYIYYSDSYTIVNGKAVLTNPSSIAGKDFTGNVNYFKPPIIGKYIQLINSSTYPTEGYKEVYKQAPNGDFKYEAPTSYGNYLTLLSNFRNMPGNVIGYVLTPTNEAPTESGYVFKSMGQLGDKVRIATGSYTGTGTYGSSNPNSLTFEFAPAVLLVSSPSNYGLEGFGYDSASNVTYAMIGSVLTTSYKQYFGIGVNTNATGYGKKSSDGKKFSWYNKASAANQWNASNKVYHYFAIG